MGLNDIFEQPEKPLEEKKLEVITSEEALLDTLLAYFENSKYLQWKLLPEDGKKYFDECMKYLQRFTIEPKIIYRFNEKAKMPASVGERQALGLCLSAMIQISYNQGFNDFEFKEVPASCLGGFLQGQQNNKIKIKVGKSKGVWFLDSAENAVMEIQDDNGFGSRNVRK
ncbi:hypothetical protein HY643_03885 [Candidatus Woesearchaeota archaeon]|nr:hypothetical protein [Candidatus Woesearchaeota archaeon]